MRLGEGSSCKKLSQGCNGLGAQSQQNGVGRSSRPQMWHGTEILRGLIFLLNGESLRSQPVRTVHLGAVNGKQRKPYLCVRRAQDLDLVNVQLVALGRSRRGNPGTGEADGRANGKAAGPALVRIRRQLNRDIRMLEKGEGGG